MAWFGLFGTEKRDLIDNPTVGLDNDGLYLPAGFAGLPGFSGEIVSEETALGIPAVWAAVNVIARTVASLPFQMFKDGPDGRVLADADPRYGLLHDVVNTDMETSFDWRNKMMLAALLHGRAYSFIARNKAGVFNALWYLDPMKVQPFCKDNKTQYLYRNADGSQIIYNASDIIDICWFKQRDGVNHLNPLTQLRNALSHSISAVRYSSTMFQNGGVPPVVVTGPIQSAGSAARASNDVQEMIASASSRKRNVMMMPAGWDLKPVGLDPAKTQLIDVQRFMVEEVARIWNVPPAFLQDLTTGTFSNAEQQDLAFTKHTLGSWLKQFEQQCNAKLFKDRNTFVEFNVDGLLRGDYTTRMMGYQAAINSAVLTPNEARQMENRPPMGGGDELWIQGATVPLAAQAGYDPNKPKVIQVPNPITEPDNDDEEPDTPAEKETDGEA